MKFLENGKVISNREIRQGIISMWINAPLISEHAQPGQFVHVRVRDSFFPLLRRPLSIGRVHGNDFELIWRIVGRGTEILAGIDEGGTVDLLGPLGQPFRIETSHRNAILVAGGLGFPPISFLYEKLANSGINLSLLLGCSSEHELPLSDDDELLSSIIISSEKGNKYRKGLVTEPLNEILEKLKSNGTLGSTSLYSCGPWGLINALQKIVPQKEILNAEVSLEQQMGCGIGVCQGCAVNVNGGPMPYKLVCSDGPVFNLFDVEVPFVG